MKNTHTLTCSKKKYLLPVIEGLNVELDITENPYNIPVDHFFTMAARINKKRSFLFVSKLLGKHLPIHPEKGLITGELLAARYAELKEGLPLPETEELLQAFLLDPGVSRPSIPFVDKKYNPVIIGFAETATALGHSFYNAFKAAGYFHTTRETLPEAVSIIDFEEEHSHATSHRCYADRELLDNQREVILVDDEMTTGKTAVNIIRSIQAEFPRSEYTVASILDWRSQENQAAFQMLEKELGITINSVSLLKGEMQAAGEPVIQTNIEDRKRDAGGSSICFINLSESGLSFEKAGSPSITLGGGICNIPYLKGTGRFGLQKGAEEPERDLEAAAALLAKSRKGDHTLVLGTGEFMYIPMKVASQMGEGVFFQSTTRSPVHVLDREGYGAREGLSFPNPEDADIRQFVYNITPGVYDDLFILFEREPNREALVPLLEELKKTGIKDIKIVYFNGGNNNG
ncbi:phosphoribosyltransferase family protein [Bacillus infantis]|uniref:phosphoribosyltransferase family protein n=1 Tax=Bacillus infantis TaxID=324767 RepID=UPI002FBDE092